MAMTSPAIDIRFDDVSLAWSSRSGKPTVALEGMRCTFRAGKVTAIIGPSGCGKSTMLQIARRFLEPTGGEVRFIDNRSMHSSPAPAMATVWQNFNLFP